MIIEIFFFLLIFLSRILFLSISPSFFDSLEYLKVIDQTSLVQALKIVHPSTHPAFITASWLFNKLPFSDTFLKIELLQAFFGFGAVLVFYFIVKKIAGTKKALWLSLIFTFLPYVWLAAINLVYESQLIFFLLLSFLMTLRNKYWAAGLFWGLAFLVSPVALFSLPLTGLYLFQYERKKFITFIIWSIVFFFAGLAIYFFIADARGEAVLTLLNTGADIGEKIQVEGILFFGRAVRNSLIIYFNYWTIPLGIIILILAFKEFSQNKKTRLLFGLWLAEFLYLNSVWHLGMFGRISLILSVCPIFLLLKKNEIWLKSVAVFLIVFSAIFVIPYRFQKTPYVLEKEYVSNLSKKPLMIMSSYEEPYLKEDLTEYRVLNSPQTDLKEIKGWLGEKLKENKEVFITSQAISAPYFQYDGMNYHILSKRKNHPETSGKEIINGYKLEKIWTAKSQKIEIYQLMNN